MSTFINYAPSPTVAAFIRDYTPKELFFNWIIGPVGSSKTTGIFFKLVYMARLQDPSPIDGIRRSRAVIVRNTAPQLRDTTINSWNYWFREPTYGIWRGQNTSNAVFMLKFDDVECEVLFRPLDTPDDVARVLSLEVTFAIIDEFVQVNQHIIEALSARCGRYPPAIEGGATNWGMWGASNPGNADSWWHAQLETSARPLNWVYYKQPSGFSPFAENLDNLPGRAAYYTSLAVGKSVHWVKQFIEVEWGYSLDGTPVVKTFNPQLHVVPEVKFDPKLPLLAGYDPGLAGSALIFGQLDLNGRLLVTTELVQSGYGTDRLCKERLRPHLAAKYPSAREFIIAPDPAAQNRGSSDEKSSVDWLRKHGYVTKFPDSNNRLEPRLQAIENFTTRLTPAGPALQIDSRCRTLIQALATGWRYRLRPDDSPNAEPEKNQYSHPGDAFGYLCRYAMHSQARFATGGSASRPLPTHAGHAGSYHAR